MQAMSKPCKWAASRSRKGNTEIIRMSEEGGRLSFRELFGLLRDSPEFSDWYSELLTESPFDSFFWEHPPLTDSSVDCDAEFVIIDAPMLAGLTPNEHPFRAYFGGDDVVTFQSLGGDATLIAPSPGESRSGYGHLATFLREAPPGQVNALWRRVGRAVSRSLSAAPLWLSTSGLCVAWLHIRLDSTPKYYQHRPYKMSLPGERSLRC